MATLIVAMNANRGGAFNDESFGNARARALEAYTKVFSCDSEEFLEQSEHLLRDFGLTSHPGNATLRNMFLAAGAQAIRPQDKASIN